MDQFEQAKKDILGNQVLAHLWAPVLQSIGPALPQEAKNALSYGEGMVSTWLQRYMFSSAPDAKLMAGQAARHFNDATNHKSPGRRIDRDEARLLGLKVEDLETSQALQEAVLTAYHLGTIGIEKSPTAKILTSDVGRLSLKTWMATGK